MFLAEPALQPDPNQQPTTTWLVNVRQAAEVLAVSENTIWNLVRDGHISAVKVTPTSTRFWLSDLIQYAKSRTRRAYDSGNADTPTE
jgi:excisionase family DNA binding protein